ncbi:septal ring lytic transglycosylase RlpA family protein [Nitratifractor sp.]
MNPKGSWSVVLLSVLLFLAGCATDQPQWKVHKRYFSLASHYGPEWEGRQTAMGTTFHNAELTAAHKSLPFGTKVRVTLLSTQKSVVVTVTDRGPYVKGREIDLSDEAARRIGLGEQGVGEVLIEVLELGKLKYRHPSEWAAEVEKRKRLLKK